MGALKAITMPTFAEFRIEIDLYWYNEFLSDRQCKMALSI
jgi:hypothetical protein